MCSKNFHIVLPLALIRSSEIAKNHGLADNEKKQQNTGSFFCRDQKRCLTNNIGKDNFESLVQVRRDTFDQKIRHLLLASRKEKACVGASVQALCTYYSRIVCVFELRCKMPFELRPSGWDLVTYRLELAQDLWADILTSFIPARKNDEAFVDQLRRYQFCLDKRPVKSILHTPEIDSSYLEFTKWGSQQSMFKHGSSRDVIGQPTNRLWHFRLCLSLWSRFLQK